MNIYSGAIISIRFVETIWKEYGYKVNYETFDSNEAMEANQQGGTAYDIAIPSEYMIQKWKREITTAIGSFKIHGLENIDSRF